MDDSLDKEFQIIVIGKKEYKIPYATNSQVEKVEISIIEKCKSFVGKLKEMDDDAFINFLNDNAMYWDVERGLIPGQIPHRIYRHTVSFIEFENQLWDEINLRLDKTGDDFLKIPDSK